MGALSEDSKNINSSPLLIYDKEGFLGSYLIAELDPDQTIVYLTKDLSLPHKKNVYPVLVTKRIPVIPKAGYAKQILVYRDDKMLLKLLPAFAKKALEDKAPIYFLIYLRDATDKLLDYVSGVSSSIRIVLVGDLMSKESLDNPVSEILQDAGRGRVVISDPLSQLYPLGLKDLIGALKHLILSNGVSGNHMLYALPPHLITKLSFVRTLHKKEPLIVVDLQRDTYIAPIALKLLPYTSLLGSDYDFGKSIPGIKISKGEKSSLKRRKLKYKNPFLPKRIVHAGVMLSLVFIFGLPVFSGLIGSGFLMRAKEHILDGELLRARSSASAANAFFAVSNKSFLGIELFKFLGAGKSVSAIENGVRSGEKASSIMLDGIDGVLALKRVFANESENPKKDFLISMQHMRQLVLGVSVLKAEGSIPKEYEAYIRESEQLSGMFDGLYEMLPELFGMEGERKYLILFQNNMELRPGGGFIGSFGVLRLKNGKIIDFPIHDVYDADGQLGKHIEPPFQMRRYLGASHWYLRDSNFELDFAKNGAHAAFFYNAEMKDEVDGVIAIDTHVLKKLLAVVGPLKMTGYNETITAENFFLLTESYAQDNFFPGSNQKQNFLKAVSTGLFSRLFEEKGVSYQGVIRVISESIREKHMLFAHPDQSVQKVFDVRGGGSSLRDLREEKEGAFNDFLGINEANLGMNKANYYLDRSISHEVKIDEAGTAQETVRIHYLNRSAVGDKYGGDYKAYLRLILPKNAALKSIQFDGAPQDVVPAVTDPVIFTATDYTPQSGLEVENTKIDGKEIYGFLITVPSGKKKIVTVSYVVSVAPSKAGALDYSLKIFKQPGTGPDAYAFSLSHPDEYKVLSSTEGVKLLDTRVSLLTNLVEDRQIRVSLGRR